MKRNISIWLVLSILCPLTVAYGQQRALKLVSPAADNTVVNESTVYFRGTTDPKSKLILNGSDVTVYSTGVFAAAMGLCAGRNEFEVLQVLGADTVHRQLIVQYEPPMPAHPTAGFAIEYARVLPQGELWLQPGDLLQVEMKATPGMRATFFRDIPLHEIDATDAGGIPGIYRGEYTVQPTDVLASGTISFTLYDEATNNQRTSQSNERVTFLTQHHTLTGLTTADDVPLFYGLGTDRLGGARMGHLSSGVKLEIIGKQENMYRVRLSSQTQAYVPANQVRVQQGVHFRPYSLTGSWSVYTDGAHDYVAIGLDERLPYTSIQQQDPTRIVLDIHGAVSNSNWITQKDSLRAVKNVWYEQVADDVFRVYIEPNAKQLWGYSVNYEGNRLIIRVKPQPAELSLRRLTIAVDAGHGGSNSGAAGMTGVSEKELNLSMALKLRAALRKAGATVIMTRENDKSFTNSARLRWLKQQDPDILISIHCNSARNPLVQGASTYYRHHAFRPVSQHIYTAMRRLGLADFGNVGGFNFVLNSPTEFPSVLVEVAFMSNPADEERLLDKQFHDDIALSIVDGLTNFLTHTAASDLL